MSPWGWSCCAAVLHPPRLCPAGKPSASPNGKVHSPHSPYCTACFGCPAAPVLPPALSPYLRSMGMGRRPPPGACGAGAGGIHHPKGMSRGMCTSSHIYYKWWLSGVPFLFFLMVKKKMPRVKKFFKCSFFFCSCTESLHSGTRSKVVPNVSVWSCWLLCFPGGCSWGCAAGTEPWGGGTAPGQPITLLHAAHGTIPVPVMRCHLPALSWVTRGRLCPSAFLLAPGCTMGWWGPGGTAEGSDAFNSCHPTSSEAATNMGTGDGFFFVCNLCW